jgi:hypothetical protein
LLKSQISRTKKDIEEYFCLLGLWLDDNFQLISSEAGREPDINKRAVVGELDHDASVFGRGCMGVLAPAESL